MNVSKPSELGLGNRVEMVESTSAEQSDDIDDSSFDDYKETSYKLFKFRDYKIRSPHGDFACPFCAYEEDSDHHYVHLLQHAIRVAEIAPSRKERAKHLAMARYLVFDLANEVNSEAVTKSDRCQNNALQGTSSRKRSKPSGDSTEHEKVDHDKIRELESEIDHLKDQLNALITKNRLINDELQGARRELIEGLSEMQAKGLTNIGIRKIGELNPSPFIRAVRSKLPRESGDTEIKGVELCSLWQEKIKDPHWYPFRIVEDAGGVPQRRVKHDDPTLCALRVEWGSDIQGVVVRALIELEAYNPSGCYMVPELWNFAEMRKASPGEAIRHIFQRLVFFVDPFKPRSKPKKEKG